MAPVGSFVRFFIGFCTFISVGFGVTYVANVYASAQDAARQQAAAAAFMLGTER
ncbi:MAG TPA: hypothetical protein VJH33_03720 [Candidatus Paceibacterota bacterium]